MTHSNAPLSLEGRGRLVNRCLKRPNTYVAAQMAILRTSRYCDAYGLAGHPSARCGPHRAGTLHELQLVLLCNAPEADEAGERDQTRKTS